MEPSELPSSDLHPLCLLLSCARGIEEQLIYCSYKVPIADIVALHAPRKGPGTVSETRAGNGAPSLEQKAAGAFTLATEEGCLLNPQKTLIECGIKPPQQHEQREVQQQHQLSCTLCLPPFESPQGASKIPRLFLTPTPMTAPLRLSVVQAKDGQTDIIEVNGWEKVAYLECWAERRFASLLRSSCGNSNNYPCPVLPGSNGKGFVLIFLGVPLSSSQTLLQCGLQQHDRVYIYFAADAPPLPLSPAKCVKAAPEA
ncbi:hypothetical protein cyc_06007 [Cyclospora cayetanensis]|uniref:Uncharacterized protein n=1 Tax=Cyclospora cayetanensis TaxID=88456 RepID=A0A1D3CT49_9EIME|nr:hypothetical protein cyc_06007 [Cyclospora cayetanensis]